MSNDFESYLKRQAKILQENCLLQQSCHLPPLYHNYTTFLILTYTKMKVQKIFYATEKSVQRKLVYSSFFITSIKTSILQRI